MTLKPRTKAGARHSSKDQGHIDKALDELVQAGGTHPNLHPGVKTAPNYHPTPAKSLADAPGLRAAGARCCAGCVFWKRVEGEWDDGYCTQYDFQPEYDWVCDTWQQQPPQPLEVEIIESVTDGETNTLKAVSVTDDEIRVANYIVLFGGRDLEGIGSRRVNADGSRGEFFTKTTQFESDATRSGKLPIDWEHGRAKKVDGLGKDDLLGYVDWKTARVDERGVWVERVLKRAKKYADWILDLVKAGVIGTSSEAEPDKVEKRANGEIVRWPLKRDSFTVQPMDPRMRTQNVLAALKALGIDTINQDGDETPEAEGTGDDDRAPAAAPESVSTTKSIQEIDMDPEQIKKLIAEALAAHDAAKATELQAELDRQAKEQERIDAAVAAEKAKWEKEAAKSRRLPYGDKAPAQARFAGSRKYDSLSAGDTAFLIGILDAGKRKNGSAGASEGVLKALAIKVAEDKSEVGEAGRKALYDLGLDPDDALDAAKANELDYSTQTGYGDEFVPTVYGTQIWAQVRAQAAILAKIPTQSFEGPGDTFPIPVEGADPTWYRIGQATDLNATTGRPDATIGDSKVATANASASMTLTKVGARVPYTGEITEDSIIPWVAQVRGQTEKSFAEQMEHLVIDGDTATGATTNINHIGGTPTSTGTKQDLFLGFNGLRKSPLVTTTANSRSAGGLIADTDFLETLKLMGTAGLVGMDVANTEFIIDMNTNWKILTLTSVKTRDVFLNATIENGFLKQIWGYKVNPSFFMHYKSSARKANTSGKVDQTTPSNNTTGSILAVRWDQWLLGIKRIMSMKLQDIPDSDAQQLIATARLGLVQRDTEGSAITYNVGV